MCLNNFSHSPSGNLDKPTQVKQMNEEVKFNTHDYLKEVLPKLLVYQNSHKNQNSKPQKAYNDFQYYEQKIRKSLNNQ